MRPGVPGDGADGGAQAKVDANHPDGMVDASDERIYGATLEQEERIRA